MDIFGSKRRKDDRDNTDRRQRERRARIEAIQIKSEQTITMMTTLPKCPKKVAHR